MNPDQKPGVIKITLEEANSSHVDDLLKRQMSMRGEPGVTRGQGRHWYYQNWFVFMLFGTLAAVAAWAVIEPFFADLLYFQGTIVEVKLEEGLPDVEGHHGKLRLAETGWIRIKGEKIWFVEQTRMLRKDGKPETVDPSEFKVGQTVGLHVEYFQGNRGDAAVAFYVKRDPPAQSQSRDALTLFQLNRRSSLASMLLFPMVAGLVGLAIGSVDGIICRLPRRALLSGLVGLVVGFIGGFVSSIVAGIVYAPLNALAMHQMSGGSLTTVGFGIQMIGRSLAWGLAGMAMGLGQGIALRSKRLLIYGFIGGVVGGLLGGLLFDPINMLGSDSPSAFMSRLIALAVVGAAVGAMIGFVELLARDAWLRMTQGPLTGKEFLLFKDVMKVGSSPRSDIYLFNDPSVAEEHAILRAVGDECEIECRARDKYLVINNRSVQHARLRHGDQVMIGRTAFLFQKRRG